MNIGTTCKIPQISNIRLSTMLVTIYLLMINDGMIKYVTANFSGGTIHIIFFLWFISSYANWKRNTIENIKQIYLVIYIIIITLMAHVYFNKTYVTQCFYNALMLFEILLIYQYYLRGNNIVALKPAIGMILFDDVAVIIRSLYYVSIDSLVVRGLHILTDRTTGLFYTNKIGQYVYSYGIADYSKAYCFVILGLISFYFWSRTKKIKWLITIFAWFFIEYKFGFSIAILMFAASIAMMIAITSKQISRAIFLLIGLPIAMLVFSNLYEILTTLSNIAPDVYCRKILEIRDYFLLGQSNSGSDLILRLDLYRMSIIAFLQNPIFGVFMYEDGTLVGFHSTVFDWLGIYGILSFPFFFFWYKLIYKDIKRCHDNDRRVCLIGIYTYFVMMSFINPSFIGKLFMYMLIIPHVLMDDNKSKFKLNCNEV